MADIAPKILALIFTPPGIIILFAIIGFLIHIRWALVGNVIVALSIAALLILSLPFTGVSLVSGIESRFPPLRPNAIADITPAPGAIVILGAGRYSGAPEYESADSVNRLALERLRYGAHLHRSTGLPILVSGGAPYGESTAEAELMRDALTRDFRVAVKWIENKSANTHENAKFSKILLAESGIKRVYLVTHALHMPRAVWAFENLGVPVVPAPMGFTTLDTGERETLGYFPSAGGLSLSSLGLRERLGLIWYKHRYATATPESPAQPAPAR